MSIIQPISNVLEELIQISASNQTNTNSSERFQVPDAKTEELQKIENVASEKLAEQPNVYVNEISLNQKTVYEVHAVKTDFKNTLDSILIKNEKNSRSDALEFITTTLEKDLDQTARAYLYQRKTLILFIQKKFDDAIMAATAGKICLSMNTDEETLIALNLYHAQALYFQTCNNPEEEKVNQKNALELLDTCLQSPNIVNSSDFQPILNLKLSILHAPSTIKEYSNFIDYCLTTYDLPGYFRDILLQHKNRIDKSFAPQEKNPTFKIPAHNLKPKRKPQSNLTAQTDKRQKPDTNPKN